VRHLAATAAALTDPRTHHTLCRIGAGLVGIDPSGTTRLHPALTLAAPVVAVRRVRAGSPVGYGHSWIAPADTALGLLPVGYAAGLPYPELLDLLVSDALARSGGAPVTPVVSTGNLHNGGR
jgi:alanine racemase